MTTMFVMTLLLAERLFHILAAAMGSARPIVCHCDGGTTSAKVDDKCRCRQSHYYICVMCKAGGVVWAAQATDGLTRSAGTTTTYHQLICGGDPSCKVIRG